MSLVLNFGEPLGQLVDAGAAARRHKTLVIGEVRRPITLQSEGRVELLGVRFWPGAIRWFLDASVAQIVDGIADESSLAGALARDIARIVYSAERAERVRLLQDALVNRVKTVAVGNELVGAAVRALVRNEGLVRIDALAASFGVSRRCLERQFAEDVGIAPKYLANVLRFRRVLRAIATPSIDWAEISVDCGYYDQSHLIRDFKRFTGRSPSVYCREAHALTTLGVEATESSR